MVEMQTIIKKYGKEYKEKLLFTAYKKLVIIRI